MREALLLYLLGTDFQRVVVMVCLARLVDTQKRRYRVYKYESSNVTSYQHVSISGFHIRGYPYSDSMGSRFISRDEANTRAESRWMFVVSLAACWSFRAVAQ